MQKSDFMRKKWYSTCILTHVIYLNLAPKAGKRALKFISASAEEAKLGALFINGKKIKIIRLILEEMGHPQPPTPVHFDNKAETGIAKDTVKKT